MVGSKFVLLAFIALCLLLSGAETREIGWARHTEQDPLCCINQQQFGTCETKEDDLRCEKMCIDNCRLNKGGGCQPVPSGAVCQCYC
ncbi:hypothetical protein EUTSA_v10015149mg [Eutrema salsugineum]|uniref:Knottin scorpion toxin-like domain-containing protein n=1 Tax=Eutrema salsugineum TaxID=72664 RepID=V4N7L0_EUTSA|nr:defensin-like protein 24 [Eutrema salsugineum]ESQ41636.1 hypothetical protein EUTSA_v10015149mg [Eutrema salsugineum]